MTITAAAKQHTLMRSEGFSYELVTPLSGAFIKYVLQQEYMPNSNDHPTITDKELKLAYANNAIKAMQVFRIDSGSYRIVVSAKIYDRTGDYLLFTARKTPKEFVSLDRLLKYLEETYGEIQQFNLSLRFNK